MPRIHIDDLTRADFLERFHEKQAVMITGGVRHWKAQEAFTKEFLRATLPAEAHYLAGVALAGIDSLISSNGSGSSSVGAGAGASTSASASASASGGVMEQYMFIDLPGGTFDNAAPIVQFGAPP